MTVATHLPPTRARCRTSTPARPTRARVLMKGNEAMAEAAIAAGCDAYFGYPITPQAELLEWHLEGCAPCVAFVNTYKGTVDAAKRLRETRIPPELHRKLVAFLQRSSHT